MLVVTSFFLLVWQPNVAERARLRQVISEQRALLHWLSGASAEVRRLRGAQGRNPGKRGNESLLALVDRSARKSGLARAVKRLEPQGKNAVRLWVEQASFDQLAAWLAKLGKESGVHASAVSLERQERPGLVNGRLTLEEPSD